MKIKNIQQLSLSIQEEESNNNVFHLFLKSIQYGYIASAFDASYQGQCEGMPRYLDTPENRVEDISAVSHP